MIDHGGAMVTIRVFIIRVAVEDMDATYGAYAAAENNVASKTHNSTQDVKNKKIIMRNIIISMSLHFLRERVGYLSDRPQ